MEATERREKRTHHGHAIKRLRHTLGIKQDALASDVGLKQQTISVYEQKPVIEDDMLQKFASALNVSVDLIKELEEDPLTIIFENNNSIETNIGHASIGNYIHEDHSVHNYNPVNQIAELLQQLLESENEKIALLEKLLKERDYS